MVDVRPGRSTNQPVDKEDAMTVRPTPDTGRRHRVVAIGLGLGGLTATKALKHDLANIADAVVFLTRMAAQGTSHVRNQPSFVVQLIPTTAAVLTTLGLFVTLYVTIVRGRKRAAQENKETATAARYFSYCGWPWRPQRTSKGWC
jgi:hypothetical protein